MIETFLKKLLQNGWKQREIADKAGVPQATISKAANGADCSAETLIKIADAFKVTVDTVLGRTQARTITPQEEHLLAITAGDKDITQAAIRSAQGEKYIKESEGKGRGEAKETKVA